MAKFRFVSVVAVVLAVFGGCDFFTGPDTPPPENGEGNLVISVGDNPALAITSGADLPSDVLASLRYELTLTGPNGEAFAHTVTAGGTLSLTVSLGQWRIDAEAYQRDNLAGTGSVVFTVVPGTNSIRVPMMINGGYFDITAGSPISGGTVTANFAAAFPGTPVTVTVTPDSGYALKPETLKYNDGTDHDISGDPPYTFTMPAADVTLYAEFDHPITVAALTNGSVTLSVTSAAAGTTVTVTVTPDSGYALKPGTLEVILESDGTRAPLSPLDSPNAWGFTMPASSVTVYAQFEKTSFSVSTAAEFGQALSAIANPGSAGLSYTITVTGNISLGPQDLSLSDYNGKEIVLKGDSSARTLSLSGQGSLFTVGGDGNARLELENIALRGTSNTAPLVYVDVLGTLAMNEGAEIADNENAVGDGGGVYVEGAFHMHGGTISGNTVSSSSGNGGGVYVAATGSFYMYDGIISGNTVSSSSGKGGGVYVDDGGSFSKIGGIIYGDNAAVGLKNTAGVGHAVYVYDGLGDKKRDNTAGTEVSLDSTSGDNWDP